MSRRSAASGSGVPRFGGIRCSHRLDHEADHRGGFGMGEGMFGSGWPVVTASDELGLSTIGPPNPDVQPDPDTWIVGLGSLLLIAQPGERWLYNTGASVLGVLPIS
jgi:hypothetical protein